MSSAAEKKSHPYGVVGLYGTFALFAAASYILGGYDVILNDVPAFCQGSLARAGNTSLFESGPVLVAWVVIDLVLAIGTGLLVQALIGKGSSGGLMGALLPGEEVKLFSRLYLTIMLFEEGVFRYLFFGLLYGSLSFLQTPYGFWGIFLISAAIFAVIHLTNYEKAEDRNVLRVLPQFVGCFGLTYVFIKYGFVSAFILHFAYDCVLFAGIKAQRFNYKDWILIAVGAGYALIGGVFLQKPLPDTLAWFSADHAFALPGWGFWDYFFLILLVDGVTDVLFGLLGYDRNDLAGLRKVRELLDKIGGPVSPLSWIACAGLSILNAAIMALAAYAGYWLFSFFETDATLCVFLVASFLCLAHQGESASAVARSFFESIPELMILISVIFALGPWNGALFVALYGFVMVPAVYLKSYDD